MSVTLQNQPLGGLGGLGGLDALGQAGGLSGLSQGPGGAAEIQARLTEVILQILNLLINEIMKALQQQQQQLGGGGGGQGSGGGGPSGVSGAGGPQGASNACGPQGASNPYQPSKTDYQPQPSFAAPVTTGNSTPSLGDVSGAGGKGPAGMPAELWKDCQEVGKKTGVDPYILAAQMERESQFGKGLNGNSPSNGDGLMQVEPGTRQAYAGKFQEKMGHAYDHGNPKDQIAMAGVILADKGGDASNMLQKYNGGDNWSPGTTDSYGRVIKADVYASEVLAKAQQMKAAG